MKIEITVRVEIEDKGVKFNEVPAILEDNSISKEICSVEVVDKKDREQ